MKPNLRNIPKSKTSPAKPVANKPQSLFNEGVTLHQKGQLAQAQAVYEQVLEIQPAHFDALHLLGVIAIQTKNSSKAVALIKRAIEINPSNPAAYSNCGAALRNLKQPAEAIANYDKAIALKPDYADAYNNRGNALRDLKQHIAAIESYGKAIALNPDYADAYSNRSNVFNDLKRYDAAIVDCNKAISLKPDCVDAYNNRGIALNGLKQHAEAIESFDKAIALKPGYADAYSNRGNALRDLKQYDAAISSYDKAIALKPDFAEGYTNRGNALNDLKQHAEAIANYDKAIALKADYAEAFSNRGIALRDLKQYAAAVASCDRAIALKPEYADAYNNRAIALNDLKLYGEAIASCDKAIAIKPDYADAYSNRGIALNDLMHHAAAIASYDKAIELKPDYAEGHWNQSLCYLQMGDFKHGWEKYEWRWKNENISAYKKKRNFPQPLWLGVESLQGKTILLHSEQGLGDTIQFCRYAKLVSSLGARVILELQKPLLGLLVNLEGVAELVGKNDKLPPFDYHCPLLSLPLAFKTDLGSIPVPGNYLVANPGKIKEWSAKLGPKIKTRVGLAWSGSPTHKNDSNRSISLSSLVEHLPSGFQYVCLQKEIREADRKTLEAHPEILQYAEDLKDFTDTAALCELVDVVVSVDTVVVHLAGALGKPVWVLLPFNPDWRWLLDREDSPWYSSAKLYRQTSTGDWEGVFQRVKTDLQKRLAPHDET